MDIKRYLLSIEWLWEEIEYRKERYEYDGHFPERWRYKHRLLKRVGVIQKFSGTKKELINKLLKEEYDPKIKSNRTNK